MAHPVMTALRLVAAVAIGGAVTYFWMTMREETDMMLLAGVGIVTTLVSYSLLYMWGKGGGS